MFSAWRVNLIFLFILLFSAAIISRLVYLQVIKGDFYTALFQGLHNSFKETEGERGEIFLKNGEPLAINLSYPFVFSSPKRIKEKEKVAEILSGVLNLDKSFILEKLKSDNYYTVIKRKLTKEEVSALQNLKLDGIYLEEEKGRYYPQESLAAQVIGFLDADGKGRYGLEEFFDEILQGKPELKEKKEGRDLILTIQYPIQFEAEKLLKWAKENLEIKSGQIIVMDPFSGEILALANFPSFNPNQYEKYAKEEGLEIFKNKATQELFEPGSVFKTITMAAALEEGKITPQTTYEDPGMIKIDGWTIYNYNGKKYPGELTMTNVLEKSINTGAVFAEQRLGHNLFLKYIEKFGFFEKTGIDLLEISSKNQEIKKGRDITFATASFGQGIMVTPIQLARAYCAIANGGKLIRPHILLSSSIQEKDSEKQIISPKTASQLTAMLVSVVENGFARQAKIPGYYIAGKTGTAQVSWSVLGINKPGYSEETIQSFVGFAPAFNSRFLILVKLDNPKTKDASQSAVPIFKKLAEYIINLWQIPPDYETNLK